MSIIGVQGRGGEEGLFAQLVPSHGRCRISLILSEAMSDGGAYDMILRRASPVPLLLEPESPPGSAAAEPGTGTPGLAMP